MATDTYVALELQAEVEIFAIRRFSKSLRCATAIVQSAHGPGVEYVPEGSRVQLLLSKGVEAGTSIFAELDRAENALRSASSAGLPARINGSCSAVLEGSSMLDRPTLTTSGAVVLRVTELLGTLVVDQSSRQWKAAPKSDRHVVFAKWLLAVLGGGPGAPILRRGCGVVDVAGGKGALSTQLALLAGIRCTVVDPAADVATEDYSCHGLISRKQVTVEAYADEIDSGDDDKIVGEHMPTCWLGMHPDAATDAIIDAALIRQTAWACVPCCVFARQFSQRRTRSGCGVATYAGLVQYLREKDSRIRVAELGFEGRSIVLFMTQTDFSRPAPSWEALWRDDGWFQCGTLAAKDCDIHAHEACGSEDLDEHVDSLVTT